MFNDGFIRKYYNLYIAFMLAGFIIIGFFWINFIYSTHMKSNEESISEQKEKIFKRLKDKTNLIINKTDELYNQNIKDLRGDLILRSESIKSTLYDYYYVLQYESSIIKSKMKEFIDNFEKQVGFKLFVKDNKNIISFGKNPNIRDNLKENKIHEFNKNLIYKTSLRALNVDIYVYVEKDLYLNRVLKDKIDVFSAVDSSLISFNNLKEQISKNLDIKELKEDNVVELKDSYYYIKKSTASNFYFGYYITKKELNSHIAIRDEVFFNSLKNHMYELVFFIVLIIFISMMLLFRIKYVYSDNIKKMNKEILSVYKNKEEILDNELFDRFAYVKSIDYIIKDSTKKIDFIKDENEKLKKDLKKKNIENLVLKHKVSIKEKKKEGNDEV